MCNLYISNECQFTLSKIHYVSEPREHAKGVKYTIGCAFKVKVFQLIGCDIKFEAQFSTTL